MKITTNILSNKIISIQNPAISKPKAADTTAQTTNLPSVKAAGQSMINSNLPVSYSKIGEITIPGLDNKASIFKLANGQKVVILPKEGPTYIRTGFSVGSFNEPDELRGISHVIEHNLFKGSKNLNPGEYDAKVSKMGGSTNAFTSFDTTQYYLALQLLEDNSLEEAIKLNAYQTQFPTFPTEELESEKEPIKQEIDMCFDNPINNAFSLMLKNMYSINSTSNDLIIGTKDNINALTREKLLDYYNTWYTPDNTLTVITGDVDVDETMKLVSKYFNKKPDTSKIHQRKYQDFTPVNKPTRSDIKHHNNPNTFITMGFPIDANTTQQEIEKINIVLALLCSDNSSVSKELDKYGVTLNFDMQRLSSEPNGAQILNTAICVPEEYSETVLNIIYKGITDFINQPLNLEECAQTINSALHSFNNYSDASSSGLNSLLYSMVKENDLNYFENTQNTLLSLTSDDIKNTARKFLDLSKAGICVSHPDSTNTAKNVSFGKSISAEDKLQKNINKINDFRLQNNMEVSIFPVENSADASFSLSFESDVNNNLSRAEVMVLSEILNRGSLYKDNILFEKLQKQLHFSTGAAVTNQTIALNADIAPENIQSVLPLIKEILLNPNFTQQEFDRAKQIVKDYLLNETTMPYDLLNAELYPDEKYYANIQEQIKALDNLTLADVQRDYYQILYNSQAQAAIAAPTNRSPYLQNIILGELSQNLPVFSPFVKDKNLKIQKYQPNTTEKILTKAENNSQASIVHSYQYKYTGNIEDKAKIELLNSILGASGMSSRLFQDLRNDKKIAYRVYSDFSHNYDIGQLDLCIQTSTDPNLANEASPENINIAIDSFKKNVELLKTQKVSDEELEMAKTIYKTDLLNLLENNSDKSSVASALKDSAYGKDYYIKLYNAIDKVSPDDIKSAANYIFKDAPVTSIVASQYTLDSLNLK